MYKPCQRISVQRLRGLGLTEFGRYIRTREALNLWMIKNTFNGKASVPELTAC
ncbi:hypothetical protein BJX99DRAFT_233373 [Aspergillus californicus]